MIAEGTGGFMPAHACRARIFGQSYVKRSSSRRTGSGHSLLFRNYKSLLHCMIHYYLLHINSEPDIVLLKTNLKIASIN